MTQNLTGMRWYGFHMGGQKSVRRAKAGWAGEPTEQIAIRLPESLLRRVDRHVKRLRERTQLGISVTRADAVRALLIQALDADASDE